MRLCVVVRYSTLGIKQNPLRAGFKMVPLTDKTSDQVCEFFCEIYYSYAKLLARDNLRSKANTGEK
jgi:hypothetical protein